jgi:rhamnulokinase
MLADGVFPHLKAVRAAISESFDVRKIEPERKDV